MAVTFRNLFGGWKLLSNAVKKNLDQMPALAEQEAELEAHIARAKELANRQAALRAELQPTVKNRLAAKTLGEELRQRLAAAVQAQIGLSPRCCTSSGSCPASGAGAPGSRSPPPVPAPAETPKP